MKVAHLALAVLMACIFGLNYSAIKLGLNTFDQIIIAALRFSLCALPAIFFLKVPKADFKYVVMYGFLFSIGLILAIFSIKSGLSPGIAATVIQLGALMTALLGIIFLKEKITIFNVLGLSISVTGLFLISNIKDGSVTQTGLILALLGTLFWTLANSVIKESKTDNPLAFVAWSGVLPAIVIFLGYYVVKQANPFIFIYDNLNATAIFSILYQAYINSLLGYMIWVTLLSNYKLSVSAPTYILVPAFSLLFSNLIHDESIGLTKVVAMVLIISGVLINSVKEVNYKMICEKCKLPPWPRIKI
jgi:O-acetylserine/cysteine efflux transporter